MFVVLFGLAIGAPGQAVGSSPPDFAPRSAPQQSDELPDLRTRSSRTFKTASGDRQTRVFSGSVNYRSGDRWRAIDNRLERTADGDLTNAANRYDLELPSRLGEPVRVEHGAASLGFELVGARDVVARASGESAKYAEALPGVDVQYDVLSDAVKETLILKSADAPRQFRFTLDLSGGLAARLTKVGELEVFGTDGRARFVVPAPIVWQAGEEDRPSGAPARFAYDAASATLTLKVDDRWLSAPGRRFPVSVDPWVQFPTDGRDCTLSSKPSEQALSYCSATDLKFGKVNSYNQHAILDFDLAEQLPEWITVREAYAGFWWKTGSGTWQETTAHALTRPFVDAQASWTKAATGINWASPGGDFRSEPAVVKWFNGSAGTGGWSYWPMPGQVQRWADGTDPDYGLILRATSNPATWGGSMASTNDANASKRPYFVVDYEPTYGTDGNFTFVNENLPGIESAVNVASGRLTVHDTDHTVTTDAPGFALDRFYNSADTRGGSALEQGWKLGVPARAWQGGNLDLVIELASGTLLRFPWNDSAQAYGPDRYNNSALTTTSTQWIVEVGNSGDELFFDRSTERLVKRERAGQAGAITYDYNGSGRLTTITAPGNKVTTLTYNSSGKLTSAALPGWQTVVYTYTNGRLSHRDKGTATTGYGYTNGRLSHVWSPDGKVAFQYDSQGRVTHLTRVTDFNNHTGPTTTFSYAGPGPECAGTDAVQQTQVVEPSGLTSIYCSNAQMRAYRRIVETVKPTVYVGGTLYEDRADTLLPRSYDLVIAALDGTDPATTSGIRDAQVLVDGVLKFTATSVPGCSGPACGVDSDDFVLDASAYAGPHLIEVRVRDFAGNMTTVTWTATFGGTGEPFTPRPPIGTDPGSGLSAVVPTSAFGCSAEARAPGRGLVDGLRGTLKTGTWHDGKGHFGPETTERFGEHGYLVTRCTTSGKLILSQLVAPLALPNGGTAMVEHGRATTLPDGSTSRSTIEYLPPDDPVFAQKWRKTVPELETQALPPTQ